MVGYDMYFYCEGGNTTCVSFRPRDYILSLSKG